MTIQAVRDIILNAPEYESHTMQLAKSNLNDDEMIEFLERAAIMEFDGKQTRGFAETAAFFEIMKKRKQSA